MKKQLLFVFLFICVAEAAWAAGPFHKNPSVRQRGKEEGMLLDLGKISMGTLNDVEEKKQYLSTVQLEKQRIQNYTLRMVYENAYRLYKQGDYQRAQEMAQSILSIDPNFKQAQTLAWQAENMNTYGTTSEKQVIASKFQEAARLYDIGRLVEANDKLNEILTIQPHNASAMEWKQRIDVEIAREYARRGDEAEKKGEYQKALDAWYNSLLMRKEDSRLVAKISNVENQLRKQQVDEGMKQALDFYNKGQYVESYAVFERIMKIQPGDPRVQKYMSQLKNEIAAGYYNAGNRSFSYNKFDQAVAYWNNAKKWGADSATIDGLIKKARNAKENNLRLKQRRIVAAQRRQEETTVVEETPAPEVPEAPETIETVTVDANTPATPGVIPAPQPAAPGGTTTPAAAGPEAPGTNDALPILGGTVNRVSAEASAASRAKYIEGLDAFNQDDYERARQAWIVAKQLDPGNSDADMGLRKVEELMR